MPSPLDRRSLALAALFFVNLLYGINYVVAKGLMPGVIGPSGLILLRVAGANLLFWPMWLLKRERVAWSDAKRLVLCGVSGVAINQLMFFHGLMRTSPVHASIIMVATPILVLVLSGVLIGERITRNKALGVGLGAVGALMLIFHGTAHNDGATMLGDLFILINASSYAIFLVMVKPLMSKYSAVTVMAWCFLVGSVIVVPFGLHEFSVVDWPGLTWPQIGGLAFVVVMVTFVAYLLNTWALRVVQPSVAGTFIYLQPVLALLTAYVVMDGDLGLGWPQFTSAACIFVGVWLVGRREKRSVAGSP
ncbi:MAG: DMT family transporter [Flavobacteriales bacterium]|jgi:drug/metabolite transporter (DMT)-like permease|nr:DMT family transporter [Flavobacteriales bacterium]MBK6892084.1 DMT family transporter [Flavobacteriales bacterium]MBK7246219.1 DMT family transporter [Flavobacteriales bacterium]QQS71917.1 MAG: DMT family transporter [Flavobacteriales bacterium]HQV37699.1 DMT family transporter [Flavobacteriales bacterium]